MRGVFIKNMEIPPTCAACRFHQDTGQYDYCSAFSNLGGHLTHGITSPRPKWCPLIKISSADLRLIVDEKKEEQNENIN